MEEAKNKHMNNLWIIIAVLVVVVLSAWILHTKSASVAGKITNFAGCAQAGYPIMESYPRQCRTSDGRNFVEQINQPTDKSDLIVVDSPRPNEVVKSPLLVKGKARGNWFFEASFPVQLIGADGKVIAQAPAQAKGDWMTTEFVPFEATLLFNAQPGPATLILKKDNPSGLPEHDEQLEIPVTVSQ